MQLTVFDVSNTLDTTGLVTREAYEKPFEVLSDLNEHLLKTNLIHKIHAFTWINRVLRMKRVYKGDELFRQIFLRSLLFGKFSYDVRDIADLSDEEALAEMEYHYGKNVVEIIEEALEEFNIVRTGEKPQLRENAAKAINEAKDRGDVTIVSMEDPAVVKEYIENYSLPIDFNKCLFGRDYGTTDKSILFMRLIEDPAFFGVSDEKKKYDQINFVDDMLEELAKSDSIINAKRFYTPFEYDVVLRLEEMALKRGVVFTEGDIKKLKNGINVHGLSDDARKLVEQLKSEIKKQVHGASYDLADLADMFDGKEVFNI